MELGKNIYNLRKEKGMTQEEMAAELGVTAAAVSKWEKGVTLPDVLMLCAIADYFGATTDELLGRVCELKKLVILERGEDRKLIERLLKNHGFCAAAYAEEPEDAVLQMQESNACCILHIGQDELAEAERAKIRKSNSADCNYDEPEDLPLVLDTFLYMLEKHF